jgi:hypothetical protein
LFFPSPPPGINLGRELTTETQRGNTPVGLLYADPLLDRDAMKRKTFYFKPGSPCETLDIKPLDLSTVGSTLHDPGL